MFKNQVKIINISGGLESLRSFAGGSKGQWTEDSLIPMFDFFFELKEDQDRFYDGVSKHPEVARHGLHPEGFYLIELK